MYNACRREKYFYHLRDFLTSIWGHQPKACIRNRTWWASGGCLVLWHRGETWRASCSIWGHPDTKHKLVITLCPLGPFYKTWLTGFFHLCLSFGLLFDILLKCFRTDINNTLWKEHLTQVSTVNLLLIRGGFNTTWNLMEVLKMVMKQYRVLSDRILRLSFISFLNNTNATGPQPEQNRFKFYGSC